MYASARARMGPHSMEAGGWNAYRHVWATFLTGHQTPVKFQRIPPGPPLRNFDWWATWAATWTDLRSHRPPNFRFLPRFWPLYFAKNVRMALKKCKKTGFALPPTLQREERVSTHNPLSGDIPAVHIKSHKYAVCTKY